MSEPHPRPTSPEASGSPTKGGSFFKKVSSDIEGVVKNLSPINSEPIRRLLKRRANDSDPETDSQPPPPKPKGPSAPHRRKGGRPSHKHRGVRQDDEPASQLTGLLPPAAPQTPPRKKKQKRAKTEASPDAFFTPHSSRIAAFTTQPLPYMAFNSPEQPRERGEPSSKAAKKRLAVNTVHHPPGSWSSAGSCLTVETYQKFEIWKNDYTPSSYHYGDAIKVIHLGNPCDRPQDIRAFKWILGWNTENRERPAPLEGKRVPVFRVVYKCSGHCGHGRASSDDDMDFDDVDAEGYTETSEADQSSSESGSDSEQNKESMSGLNRKLDSGSVRKRRRPSAHKCSVTLHAEVYSDDLSKIHFYQKGTHPETLVQHLEASHYLRQCTLGMSRTLGMAPADIKRQLLRMFEEEDKHNTPSYRRPNSTQVNNIINNSRRKERLLSDPLLSIGVFAENNPDKIFCYSEPDYTQNPPRGFSTGVHHAYGTQAMLLWAWTKGIGHDATYRHMNENRAPLTIMITLDEAGRMVPGFAYLSSDTAIETQVNFLQKSKDLVEKMAEDLVNGRVPVADGLQSHAEELMKQAHLVVKHGWEPAFFMIDNSLTKPPVFPRVIVRICQFHVMQAILRWERDGSAPGEQQARPTLDIRRKHQLLWAVRAVQRCRDPAQWQAHINQFRQRLDYITEGSRTSSATLWNYFEANWFCDEWRDLWTDIGLPAGATRDSMLSTNNWTERAFKTFNQVFLGNRNNKSIYRLVLILANEWFQYYQAWEPRKQMDNELFRINAMGHNLWASQGAVQPFVTPDGSDAWRVARLD
ncbi:hypothetical protein C8R47DRAFT_1216070 [Mycena vitilis]|nr:hypothetical protein C8R47DRAFT_1216070 [Mycena vitilis]